MEQENFVLSNVLIKFELAFQIVYSGNSIFINTFDKTKFSYFRIGCLVSIFMKDKQLLAPGISYHNKNSLLHIFLSQRTIFCTDKS